MNETCQSSLQKVNELYNEVKGHIENSKTQGISVSAINSQIESIKKDQQAIINTISK